MDNLIYRYPKRFRARVDEVAQWTPSGHPYTMVEDHHLRVMRRFYRECRQGGDDPISARYRVLCVVLIDWART